MEKIKQFVKDKSKKRENLITFLIILVITLIIINNIIKDDEDNVQDNYDNAEFASSILTDESDSLEERLEGILNKMSGVNNASVLITYSSSNEIVPIFNEKNNVSVTEETDVNGRN